jgi:hypothetical protein
VIFSSAGREYVLTPFNTCSKFSCSFNAVIYSSLVLWVYQKDLTQRRKGAET